MSEVMVRGRADGHLTPDLAVLTATVVGRDPASAGEALAAAAAVGERVDTVLADGGAGEEPLVRRVRVSSVRTSEMWEHTQRGRHRVGFQAERRSEIECRPDGPDLTELVTTLVGTGAQVAGPAWQVAPDNPGWLDLRSRAVADARARAEVYAAAADSRIGAVRWLAEPGIRGAADEGSWDVVRTSRSLAMSQEGRAEEPVALQIVVEVVPVVVEIEAAFDLRPEGA